MSRRQMLAGLILAPVVLRNVCVSDAAPAAEGWRPPDEPPVPAEFRGLASTPPRGWNSWDSFGPAIREAEARANAEVMAARLLPHGYDIFTVDIQWYEPHAASYQYRRGAVLAMDEWGRLIPAPNRFPSSARGLGFKPLADHVRALGLKFGVHMMRGVPRQAVLRDTPIEGSSARAGGIADRVNVCAWNTDMYGVDMSRPGAQDYYDSVLRLYASWGVDFVKADDMSRPYFRNAPEIHAVRRAIDRCGRPMVLALSPGETPLGAGSDAAASANTWRISDDFWDTWPALLEQFERLRLWSAFARPGAWPDADMLPLGVLERGKRSTRLSSDEQVALVTLWSIARSPLIMGGDLRKLDERTASLLTNDEVLAVNHASTGNRQVGRGDDWVLWSSQAAQGSDVYIALFNLRDATGQAAHTTLSVKLTDVGLGGAARVRDLWARADLGHAANDLDIRVPCHGARMLRLSPL